MNAAIQLRGHCQACGRLQAVARGALAKHGYTIKDRGSYGWFEGTCGGAGEAPIEVERSLADAYISGARGDAARSSDLADDLLSGRKDPTCAFSGRRENGRQVMVPFSEAASWYQADARKSAVFSAQRRAKMASDWANEHAERVEALYGKPLVEVRRAGKQAA